MRKHTIPFLYDYTFSNIVLPNALMTELALVNYIHSLYSNRIKNRSFFEETFLGQAEATSLEKIFDNQLGTFPNSRGYKTHLQSDVYTDLIYSDEGCLYFGKKKYKKYIYPILLNPHFDEFTGVSLENFPKLNGEYFWKHMSAEALEDARNGNCIIFLDFGQENFVEKKDYCRLHESLRYSKIPKENIILAFNSFNSKEIYESWFTENERMLEVHNWPFVVAHSSFHFNKKINENHPSCVTEQEFIESKNVLRTNKFIFKIRRPRKHRLGLLFYMESQNLLKDGDWSCLSTLDYTSNNIDYINTYYKFNIEYDIIKRLSTPRTLKNETLSTFDGVSAWNDTNAISYKETYLYICSETFVKVDGDYKSITEKIFKPMVNYLPFVFVTYHGALQLLRDLGFKTFHPFIDESYDTETDEVKRMHMLANEIKRICSMNIDELHEWYWSMEDILRHNRTHAINWYVQDTDSLNLIDYLHARIYV